MIASEDNILVINFLNQRALKLLKILSEESPIKSVKLRNKICKNNDKLMSPSTYYRYMEILLKYNLITKIKVRTKEGGYTYYINKSGECFLKMILESNLSFYNKLCLK